MEAEDCLVYVISRVDSEQRLTVLSREVAERIVEIVSEAAKKKALDQFVSTEYVSGVRYPRLKIEPVLGKFVGDLDHTCAPFGRQNNGRAKIGQKHRGLAEKS